MKKILSLLMALLMLSLALVSCKDDTPVTPEESGSGDTGTISESETEKQPDNYLEMITYNIAYYEATEKNMTVYYENQELADYTIDKRAMRLEALVDYYEPDVLALQEVNHTWWPYIISNEQSITKEYGYDWEGNLSSYGNQSGTVSTKENDLYNLLLWNKEKFEKIKSGVFRLTDAQKDANKDRMCTYAILKNRASGVETLYASVHLCTQGDAETKALNLAQAQRMTAKLEAIAEGRMIIVGGDFNANSSSASYVHMTGAAGFSDGRIKAEQRRNQLLGTARVWGREQNWNRGQLPIDHIFYKGTTAVAEEWTVLTDTYDMHANISTDIKKVGINYDLSDHQGVYTRFREVTQ